MKILKRISARWKTMLEIRKIRKSKLNIPKKEAEKWKEVEEAFEKYKKQTEMEMKQYCEQYCEETKKSHQKEKC